MKNTPGVLSQRGYRGQRPRRPSLPRHGLLALICERIDGGFPYFCLFAVSAAEGHRYGLHPDNVRMVLNAAERAGLVEQPKRGFYLPTHEARATLERFPFEMACDVGKPCQQCIRSGMAEAP